jgi:transposase InsO family protein
MQLWQLDVTTSLFLASGRECKVITGIDDHSRYCVIATVIYRATGRAVCAAFAEAMRVYGVPAEVLSDNGKQFTGRFGKCRPAEVLFERICRENGITQRLTKPRSPTTTGRSSGCTRPCNWNCSTCTGRSTASRTPKPRWTPGGGCPSGARS